jgi:putative cell wall binding repeat protein
MRKRQPINAEVPVAESEAPAGEPDEKRPPEAKPKSTTGTKPAPREKPPRQGPSPPPKEPKQPRPKIPKLPRFEAPRRRRAAKPKGRKRQPIPLALKLIGAAVAVAVAFVVVAIVGGTGGGEETQPGPTPSATRGGGGTEAAQASEELGFPAFATSNTTRVGGDPVANAAAVALAVFPSTDEEQRPDAVTLVDEASWPTALAASVLMATPVNAPLLISGDELQEPATQALDALDPVGIDGGRGAQAFAIGDAAAPDGLSVTRVRRGGPAATAAAIAKLRDRLLGGPPEHIVIASSTQPGFAMPAAAWAARSGDPILFSNHDKLPKATASALKQRADVPVYILGPNAAISKSALGEIEAIAKRVRRIGGRDPVASAVAFARYRDGGFGWGIVDPGHGFVVARDDSPLDAVAAAPLSASGTWGPLLLSDNAATLPPVLRDYFLDVKPGYTDDPTRAFYNHVWVIGDQEAIEVAQQGEIDELAELAKIGEGQ